MKKVTALSQVATYTFIFGLAVLLPGCEWFKTGDDTRDMGMLKEEPPTKVMQQEEVTDEIAAGDTSDVLLSIAGKPVMTVKSFEEEFEEFLESNPQAKQMMAFVPDLKSQFFEGLSRSKIISYYVKEQGIDKSPEYKAQEEKGRRAVKMLLNDQFYKDRLPVEVTEAETREFYEKQKAENPRLILSVGGVKARGVKFDQEDDAKAFLDKVTPNPEQFESLVKSDDLSNQETDFKMVSEYSPGLDAPLKEGILALDSFPTVTSIKDEDGATWVIYASEKEEKKYHPYDQIKGELEAGLKRSKVEEATEKHLEELKGQYGITVNKEYFEKEQAEKAAALEVMQEQMRMAMDKNKQEGQSPTGEQSSQEVAELDDMAACVA